MKKKSKTFSIFGADKDKKDVYYIDHAVVQCANLFDLRFVLLDMNRTD